MYIPDLVNSILNCCLPRKQWKHVAVWTLNYADTFVDMCGVEGKRRLCDLNVTSSSPDLATRHVRCVLLVNRPNK